MAIGLGMQPLAEGIETDAQRRFLADRGCSLGQGYLFSPPRAAAEVRPFLTRGHAFAL
jgi:EAL domain-containing protein (putative c-di-GMP-specific phosphodiesterase class I)